MAFGNHGVGPKVDGAKQVASNNATSGGRVRGTVRFYNQSRNFGFIAPKGGGKDVFVPEAALRRAGVAQLKEGDEVSFDSYTDRHGKGPIASNLRLESSTAAPSTPQAAPSDHYQVPLCQDVAGGKVKFYNHARGFGFIVPDDGGKDVFFTKSTLAPSLPSLNEGDAVFFQRGEPNPATGAGPKAERIDWACLPMRRAPQ